MTRHYRYSIVDVFTDTRFGGNPLAVVHDAQGLDADAMQRIAREFNFSESTFVLPASAASDCSHRVRIFTPTKEVPFAGHPNVGTAWLLATLGMFGDIDDTTATRFDELAGKVDIELQRGPNGHINARLRAPQSLTTGATCDVAAIAAALCLSVDDVCTKTHRPIEASVGLPFTFVALRNADALRRAVIDLSALRACEAQGINPDIYCYVRDGQSLDARMFAPFDGVVEDPATGSAGCAITALLHRAQGTAGTLDWSVTQGVQMGRPSLLAARTVCDGNAMTDVFIGGQCMLFAHGELTV